MNSDVYESDTYCISIDDHIFKIFDTHNLSIFRSFYMILPLTLFAGLLTGSVTMTNYSVLSLITVMTWNLHDIVVKSINNFFEINNFVSKCVVTLMILQLLVPDMVDVSNFLNLISIVFAYMIFYFYK